MGHHGTLLGESLHMLCLAAEERLGDEQGEVGILSPRLLEHLIQLLLHLLPDGVAVRLDDHTASHSRLLGKVCLHYQVVEPLAVIISSLR